MNSCLGRITISLSALYKHQRHIQLFQRLRTRTICMNRNLSFEQKDTGQKIIFERAFDPITEDVKRRNKATRYYLCAGVVLVGGFTYMSVLLYRLYCQSTGKGGQAVLEELGEKISTMQAIKDRKITVNFNADINSSITWNFKPQQPYIKVVPGETALAFYTAMNPTNRPVTGVATYNVVPFEAGKYFNKIQCFCFEEQQLNPHEEVDMPVFFYLDPEYAEDPFLENVDDIVLSYTFFEAKEGLQLPRPAFLQDSK